MRKINILNENGLPDVYAAAERIAEKFGLDATCQEQIETCLPYLRPERFALSYDAGSDLTEERVFGPELRRLIARGDLTSPMMISLDPKIFELAGLLEFADRHGIEKVFGLLSYKETCATDTFGDHSPRVDPIRPLQVLPIAREALALLFEDMTGRTASLRDFAKGRGKKRKIVVRGSTADFILTCLDALGWHFSVKQLARNYENLLTIPWRNRQYL